MNKTMRKKSEKEKNMEQTMYNDAFLRCTLQDTGLTPVTGVWTCSPDIIPNGVQLIPDTVKQLTDTYNRDIGQDTVLNQQNYFYMRAKNLSEGKCTAKFELFYCPSNIFLFPELWVDNQLRTSSGATQIEATVEEKNDIIVPVNAFTFLPKESSQHYCLVGRAITDAHPNPLPDSGSLHTLDDLASFMLSHPGFAWRNVVLVQKDVPTFTHYFDLDSGDDSGQVLMGLNCTNITVGSAVAFSCGDPIPSGPDKGKLIQLVQSPVAQPNIFLGQMTLNLPKNYKTKISYSYWANTPIQSGWKVEFQAILIIPNTHALYAHAKPLSHYGMKEQKDNYGNIKKGIKIGACVTEGKN